MIAEDVARVCHEANRGLQALQPDSGVPIAAVWDDWPQSERASVVAGVIAARGGATPEQLHQSWIDFKAAEGWAYGPVKDLDAKLHPCFVPYGELPVDQRVKDGLFSAIVKALS